MLFDKFNPETYVPEYKSSIITLDLLKAKKCFITNIEETDNEKPCVVFTIINHSDEEISTSSLFTKLEACFQYYKHFLYMFDFRLEFIVMDLKEIPIVKSKLSFIKEQLKELGSYGILLSKVNNIQLISTREHMIERYRSFFRFKRKAYNLLI